MSNIYSAKFMHKASTTLESKVLKRPVNETYLFSTISALNEMNAMIDDKTKKLYLQINEAESKEDENKLFADYFYQFKSIFSEFANKIQQMKSRMIISVENKVETWKDLYEDDQYIATFDEEFSYSGYNFCHMEDSNYPRLNLQKVYQKEFDYIGRLMQDNSMSASPSARLKIIATVCNNFANCSGDKNWVKEIIKEMIDIDEKEINKSYSQCIYNSLRDKYDLTVDKSVLYTCKEALCDYQDIIDAACKLCDNLLYDLDKVAEDISSYLFRNKDNKLKIKTDTDGIIDRDYRLDTYSMNQLDLFLKNKINQIRKILNIYSVAVGIKFDTAVDYIEQNIEILKAAKTYDENEEDDTDQNEPGSEEDEDDNDDIDSVANGDDSSDGEESEDDDSDDDDEEPEDDDDFEFGSSEDDSDDDEEPIEEDDDLGDFEEEEPMGNEPLDKEDEEFSEAYLFESELFEIEMMFNEQQMHQSIMESLMLEAEEQNQNSTSELKKVANKAKDPNFFQKIIEKVKELWERFRKKFFDFTKDKIDYLKKNKEYINKKVSGNVGLKYTPNFGLIDNMKIPDLRYTDSNFLASLKDEETFFSAHFGSFYEKGKFNSVTDSIKEKVLGEEIPMEDVNTLNSKVSITAAYNFCITYENLVSRLNNTMNILDKAQKVARDISKVPDAPSSSEENKNDVVDNKGEKPTSESTYTRDYRQYFMEFETDTKANNNPEKVDNLKMYFNTCSRAMAAYMTVSHNLFVEMYNYCNWWIMRAKGGNVETTNKPEEKSEEKK